MRTYYTIHKLFLMVLKEWAVLLASVAGVIGDGEGERKKVSSTSVTDRYCVLAQIHGVFACGLEFLQKTLLQCFSAALPFVS